MRPIAQVGLRTTTWTDLARPSGLTAGTVRFRWKDGRPELAFTDVEWAAGASIPWSALPAAAMLDERARSTAVLSRTTNLGVQATIVAFFGFIWMGATASPGPMSGMLTWST